MLNFGLKLLHYWRLLRKTSYLKIKGLCGKGIYNLLKTELERLQKQGNTAANRSVVEQRADHGNKSHDTPRGTG